MALSKQQGFDLCPRLKGFRDRRLHVPRGNQIKIPESLRDVVLADISIDNIEKGWAEFNAVCDAVAAGRISAVLACERFGSAARGAKAYDAWSRRLTPSRSCEGKMFNAGIELNLFEHAGYQCAWPQHIESYCRCPRKSLLDSRPGTRQSLREVRRPGRRRLTLRRCPFLMLDADHSSRIDRITHPGCEVSRLGHAVHGPGKTNLRPFDFKVHRRRSLPIDLAARRLPCVRGQPVQFRIGTTTV